MPLQALMGEQVHETKYDGQKKIASLNAQLAEQDETCAELQAQFDRALRDKREAENQLEQVRTSQIGMCLL